MEITETFYPSDRLQWRAWLEANFESRDDIWLMVPLKASGEHITIPLRKLSVSGG